MDSYVDVGHGLNPATMFLLMADSRILEAETDVGHEGLHSQSFKGDEIEGWVGQGRYCSVRKIASYIPAWHRRRETRVNPSKIEMLRKAVEREAARVAKRFDCPVYVFDVGREVFTVC